MVDACPDTRAESRNGHYAHPAAGTPGPDAAGDALGAPAPATHPGGAGPPSSALPPEAVDAQPDDGYEFEAYYVVHSDGRTRPRLMLFATTPNDNDWSKLVGDEIERHPLGVVRLPGGSVPTNIEIEVAARVQYGGYDGSAGRPVDAECVELDGAARVTGDVALVVLNWPKFAPAGGGPASVEAVAAAIGRHPADVRDAFRRLNIAEPFGTVRVGHYGYAVGETGPDPRDYYGSA